MEQCFYHPDIWVQEKNELKAKIEEEMLDDYPNGIPEDKFAIRYKNRFVKSLLKSKMDFQKDKDSGKLQKDKPMRFTD